MAEYFFPNLLTFSILLASAIAADAGDDVRIERTDASVTRGTLLAIDPATVSLLTENGNTTVPLPEVRRVILDHVTKASAAPKVKITLIDGGELSGTDVAQADRVITLVSADGKTTLPAEKARRIVFGEPDQTEPAWASGLPPNPTSDLVIVRREDGHEFVECAVTGIAADTVSVVLDGDTIPVKRAKVAGIVWLREPTEPAGRTVMVVRGGQIEAKTIAWSPDGLVIDESIKMPAAALRSIDYAAGRTVPVATLEPERTEVEPFFGNLRDLPSLASFFGPRWITASSGEGPAILLVRPRTTLTWRVPTDGLVFRTTIERDVPATSAAQTEVVVLVDDKETIRRKIDAATAGKPIVIEADVTGRRRLTLLVDFVPGDIGCGLRFSGAAFEK